MRTIGLISMTALILTGLPPTAIGPSPAAAMQQSRRAWSDRATIRTRAARRSCARSKRIAATIRAVAAAVQSARGPPQPVYAPPPPPPLPPPQQQAQPGRLGRRHRHPRASAEPGKQLARHGGEQPGAQAARHGLEPKVSSARLAVLRRRPLRAMSARPTIASAMPARRSPPSRPSPTRRSRPSRSTSTPAPTPMSGGC